MILSLAFVISANTAKNYCEGKYGNQTSRGAYWDWDKQNGEERAKCLIDLRKCIFPDTSAVHVKKCIERLDK